jgi:hypothetical protein
VVGLDESAELLEEGVPGSDPRDLGLTLGRLVLAVLHEQLVRVELRRGAGLINEGTRGRGLSGKKKAVSKLRAG